MMNQKSFLLFLLHTFVLTGFSGVTILARFFSCSRHPGFPFYGPKEVSFVVSSVFIFELWAMDVDVVSVAQIVAPTVRFWRWCHGIEHSQLGRGAHFRFVHCDHDVGSAERDF
jgi:hypothetical protein